MLEGDVADGLLGGDAEAAQAVPGIPFDCHPSEASVKKEWSPWLIGSRALFLMPSHWGDNRTFPSQHVPSFAFSPSITIRMTARTAPTTRHTSAHAAISAIFTWGSHPGVAAEKQPLSVLGNLVQSG